MKYLLIIVIFIAQFLHSQEEKNKKIDSLYREDQFYLNLTYNLLLNRYTELETDKISLGLNVGILRDFPINKKRTWAIAPGLGLGVSNGYDIVSNRINNSNIKSNFSYANVDIPLEIRWRDSSPIKVDFMRVYTGFKVSYFYFFNLENISNTNLNNLQYGPYLSIGYGNWNFQIFQTLNPIFKNNFITEIQDSDNQIFDVLRYKTIQAGFVFYFL